MTDVAKIVDSVDMENDIGSSLTAAPRAGGIAALVASPSHLTTDAAQIRRSLRRRCGLIAPPKAAEGRRFYKSPPETRACRKAAAWGVQMKGLRPIHASQEL